MQHSYFLSSTTDITDISNWTISTDVVLFSQKEYIDVTRGESRKFRGMKEDANAWQTRGSRD